MAIMKMTCPISRGPCVECVLYRGRHYFLCFSKHYNESVRNLHQLDEPTLKNQLTSNSSSGTSDNTFGMPDTINKSSSWIADIEDFIERRGL